MSASHILKSLFVVCLLAGPYLLAHPAMASEIPSATSIRQSIESFKQSPDHAFAPQATARAEAYLGAAMLAHDQHKPADATAALERAHQTLNEAHATAKTFRQQYKALLAMRANAHASLKALKQEGVTFSDPEEDPNPFLSNGEDELTAAIKGMESGQLNETQQHAAKSEAAYRQAMDIMIPLLSDRASRLISKASSASAKRYAPQTLQAAKDKTGILRAYVDGLSDSVPDRPADALNLARAALDMALQVKAWRKQPASHEKLALNARHLRVQLAEKLHLPFDRSDPVADVNAADLLKAADALQNDLDKERLAHQADIKRLQTERKAELEARLSEQSNKLTVACNSQMSSLKEAFRAKLERETFEKKRQARVLKLFKDGEASILANLDGSLIIRLSALQFAPNKSKIDAKYYQLLSRLKQALDIYGDRNVRIEGHTDNQGDVKSNQLLSLKRAEAVRDFLIAAGVGGDRLKALGYGEVRPIASNEFAKGRAMNRRIDVSIDAAAKEESK